MNINFSNIKLNHLYYIVEIALASNDTMGFCYTLFNSENNYIKLIEFENSDNFEDLIKKLNKNIPVILNIYGRGVINKSIDKQTDSLLYNNKSNFYNIEVVGYGKHFISIIRKDTLDNILDRFVLQKFFVVDVNFGSFISASLAQITDDISELFLSDNILFFKNNLLDKFSKNEENVRQDVNIQNEKIESKNIIAYAAVINYLYPDENIIKNIPSLTLNIDEFNYKKLLMLIGKVSVFIIFFVLLSNIFINNKLHKEQFVLKNKLSKIDYLYDSINNLKNALSLKEEIINKNIINTSDYFSYYQNELFKIIPDGIVLKSLEINPRISKDNDTFSFENKLIKIKGYSKNTIGLYNWIEMMNKLNWANYVKINNLSQSKKGAVLFEVLISIK